jgi:hypothetical protein
LGGSPLQGRYVDLLHLHHRLHDALNLQGIAIVE